MRGIFEIAGGSVAGRDHVVAGRNNQDAFAWYQDEHATIAVVCDGCSEGPHSEVGAQLISRLLVEEIRSDLRHPIMSIMTDDRSSQEVPLTLPTDTSSFLYEVRGGVLPQVDMLARMMSRWPEDMESYRSVLTSHFLTTAVCVIIAPWGTVVCSIGDGYWGVNERLEEIGPFPKNEPPYLAYDLMITSGKLRTMPRPIFEIKALVPTDTIQSVLIGTDGVGDLIAAADRTLPGKSEVVGPLAQFWTDDRYFRNPDMVRRRLTLINRESVRVEHGALVRVPGLLRDDTTLIAIRRRKEVA